MNYNEQLEDFKIGQIIFADIHYEEDTDSEAQFVKIIKASNYFGLIVEINPRAGMPFTVQFGSQRLTMHALEVKKL
jgi:hypothetical protein